MDFKDLINEIGVAACVLSVNKNADGTCGDVHIIEANEEYANQMQGYVPGMIYSDLVPKDLKFEDYCFQSAFMKKRMHAYVKTVAFDCWTDQLMIPLSSDSEDIGYCLFLFEFTKEAEADRRATVSHKVANDVVRACIKMKSSSNFLSSMQDCVKDIRFLCNADSCAILSVNWELEESNLLAFEMAENPSTAVPDSESDVMDFERVIKTWPDTIGVSDCVIIKTEKEMEALIRRNPAWGNSLKAANVVSVVLYPLYFFEENVGYIWVTNFDKEMSVHIKETLELTAFFLGAEIANYNLMNKLKRMGTSDQLTGLNNRHALTEYLDQFQRGIRSRKAGFIYADINGLKKINDDQGHIAGDNLINSAAALLKEVFDHSDIYRIGGDEFVVITEDIDPASYEERVAKLKNLANGQRGVRMAIGSYYSDNITDVTKAMYLADEYMYEDKKRFYAENPHLSRRK